MAEVTDLTVDDEYDIWVCPVHGIISEYDLLEGHDGTMYGSGPDGDPYTGQFYCGKHGVDAEDVPLAHVVNVREDVEEALKRHADPTRAVKS